MTADEIALVRQSFEQIAPHAERVGTALYERLFAEDPSLRLLFRTDMRTQVGHFMAAVAMVVRSLDDLGPILGHIEALGRRHVTYGVEPRHIAAAGGALLATLEAELGEAFIPEMRAAWANAYTTLAGAMIAAMRETIPAPA
jgi:hemoglobin-like flavoprotein